MNELFVLKECNRNKPTLNWLFHHTCTLQINIKIFLIKEIWKRNTSKIVLNNTENKINQKSRFLSAINRNTYICIWLFIEVKKVNKIYNMNLTMELNLLLIVIAINCRVVFFNSTVSWPTNLETFSRQHSGKKCYDEY